MVGSQKLDKLGDNTSGNDVLDGRVLFLGQELAELGGGIVLFLDIVRVDIGNQGDQVGMELTGNSQYAVPDDAITLDTLTLISSSTSISSSLSDMDALGIFMLRRLDKFSSRFCFRISTVCFCLRFLTWSEPKASLFLKAFFLSAAAVLSISRSRVCVIDSRRRRRRRKGVEPKGGVILI